MSREEKLINKETGKEIGIEDEISKEEPPEIGITTNIRNEAHAGRLIGRLEMIAAESSVGRKSPEVVETEENQVQTPAQLPSTPEVDYTRDPESTEQKSEQKPDLPADEAGENESTRYDPPQPQAGGGGR